MKTFEVSSRKCKNGRRKFKAILHEIYPDSCVDTENECGTQYNLNGITWLRSYCEAALPTIKDMSLRVEFLDEERSEICGHGDTGVDDGLPLFEDATVIGHFTKGYIDTITDADGNEKTVCCGEGYIDEMCYHNYVAKLEEDVANDLMPSGSVEIFKTETNEAIKYLYGYKKTGRIPTEFIYSGFAVIGVQPADNTAQLLELNTKEDNAALGNHTAEMNEYKASCDTLVSEANAKVEAITSEMNELKASSEQIQKALDEAMEDLDKKHKELAALYEELDELREIVLKSEQHTGEDDLDFYFHYRLVELSGNSIFMGIVNTYFNEIREIRDRNLKKASHRFEVQKEHLAIIDAICSRNQAAAAQAVEAHMARIWERWRQRNTGAVEDN